MKTIRLATALAMLAGTPAIAAEYLTELTSDVYQAPGTAQEIAQRAMTCISRNLAPGRVDAQLIVSSDLPNGVIVARNALRYGNMPVWEIRSTFTFEARDGRFRIRQSNLERFNDMAGGWGPIGKWTGSGASKAEAAFASSALTVAQCAMSNSKQDKW